MPSAPKTVHVRIHDAAQFIRLAGLNRRSYESEANIAVENHIAANRVLLRRGPKLKSK